MSHKIQRRYVLNRTQDEFHAFYRRHEITIERESNRSYGKAWYIVVIAPCGSYAYDGWWGELDSSLDDAIAQALVGSGLVKKGAA